MPNILKKIFIWILSAAMAMPLFMQCASAQKSELSLPYLELPVTVQTITVGLRSGSSPLYETKFVNRVGSGYSFGYYDITRTFKGFGYTGAKAISLRGDLGFYLDEKTYIGSWHILLDYSYSDFENAKNAASSLGGFPAYISGQYRVLIGAYNDKDSAEKAIAELGHKAKAYCGSDSAILVAESGTANFIFMYDNPGGHKLAVKPNADGNTAETWYSGYYYYGSFECERSGSGIKTINYVDLESYVRGVLPYEMNGEWPLEALKAQAVCARTYVINSLNSYAHNGFDVRSDTYSQVYRGMNESNGTTDKAASSTSGEFARYKGEICKVYYMSSDGGMTETGENTFKQRRNYLSAVEDPYESEVEHYNENWDVKYTPLELQYILNRNGYEMAEIADIAATKSEAGNVIGLTFTDVNGKQAKVYNVDCYKVLNLNSINYEVSQQTIQVAAPTPTGAAATTAPSAKPTTVPQLYFDFYGHGWGHNCGMSQWGSYAMADSHDMSYKEIIKYYFSGAYVK